MKHVITLLVDDHDDPAVDDEALSWLQEDMQNLLKDFRAEQMYRGIEFTMFRSGGLARL